MRIPGANGRPTEAPATTRRDVELIVESLKSRFEEVIDADTLTAVVEADFQRYESARITDFVPALVERDVLARLAKRKGASP